jgi:RNA polymerase sigma-70 factor (ECF subfamily)
VSITENELIARARNGDTEAFCELAKGYQRRIYSLALHYCRHPHDAEDLSQEVWLRAYKSIGKFRGESGFYTWLRQITINAFLNHQREQTMTSSNERKAVRMEELELLDQQATLTSRMPDEEDGLHAKILLGRVIEALGELTPHERLMFLLKHREGMTYEEISKALNCSTGTIKKALFRAVVKLRQHLGINPLPVAANDYAPFAASEKS